MKVKRFLLGAILMATVSTVSAQKGVDNGTPYGAGEDSIRCLTNISLFIPYAKVNNFKDAYPFWKIAYDECPGATKDLYLYGVRIVNWQISQETDAAKRESLINDLMTVYDKRVKYFGDDKKYGKDWIVARKAQDYIGLKGEDADATLLYGWLSEIVNEFGDRTEALGVSLYMFASYKLLQQDMDKYKAQYVQDFLKSSAIFDTQIAEAKANNNEKEAANIEEYKTGIEKGFASSGAADCETLESIYKTKIEDNKDNIAFLKETITLLRRVGCQENESYFAASEYAHKIEPTSESALGMGKQALKKNDYAMAEKYLLEAASMATEDDVKGDIYFSIAVISYEQNSYSKSRDYCRKALEVNPNSGKPYLLIGNMYAKTAGSVYPNDPELRKCVYYAAVDKFESARRVDPSCAEEATKLINTYRGYFPTTEEIFMNPNITKGEAILIGGWIGERTIVR
ncbi:MAG: tetratricopeptide repeat protein [Tannerella sp.]|nr:tetratricopeptide repeat protein [Tannerella sp.]